MNDPSTLLRTYNQKTKLTKYYINGKLVNRDKFMAFQVDRQVTVFPMGRERNAKGQWVSKTMFLVS